MPILAKIAVSAAKIADSTAHICQEENRLIERPLLSPFAAAG
jgi:hypothetical protein